MRGADVISAAPELARLTLNMARAHHDAEAAGGRRLVYGCHTIGLALSHVSRALPNIVTVAAWQACDHLGRVREGDSLVSELEITGRRELPHGGGLVDVRVLARAAEPVLDWRMTVVLA